jgi:hypothetical protein
MGNRSSGVATIWVPERSLLATQDQLGLFDWSRLDGIHDEDRDAVKGILQTGGTLEFTMHGANGGLVFGMTPEEWAALFAGCDVKTEWQPCPGAYPEGYAVLHDGKLVLDSNWTKPRRDRARRQGLDGPRQPVPEYRLEAIYE